MKVFNTTTGTEVELPAEKVSIDNGTTDSAIPTDSVTAKIADLEKRGYVVENKDLLNNQKFDKEKDPTDGDPTQVFNLKVHEKVIEVTEPPTPNTPVDPNVPVEPDKPVDPTVPKWPAEGLKESDLKKEVTRTITYVKKETPNGEEVASGKEPVTQTAHFTRKASYNVVTGTITYGKWESADKELAKVDTPELTGYVADKASVDKVETNADSTGLDQKVVYTKLGSWVPRLPEGVTPPTGTDMTPKPYPNNPTDPTKPGDPTDPNTPNVPVIPYVPGYTPKIGETPLQPKVPNDPTQGYIPPAVPTEPGKDTPITYEKVPNTPTPEQPGTTDTKEVTRTIKYVDEKGNELAKPSTDKVTFKGNGSDWKAVGGDSTFDAVKSPVVKGYVLKDPAQKVVEKETVKSDAKDETITVTYTKVGSFVPKVPEGVTPKTPLTPTPYDNDPEDPTKVVTPNPEKPQDPKDPNSPKVPVIPQVPGHTPVVPKDPTKPVSPENPLVPLTPVDPNHPEKGYNVPPVPTIPGQDTPITYVKDGQQKAITSFVDPKGNVLETPITETGDSNTPLTKDGEIKATIAKLKLKGYDVETNTYPPKGTFDNDPKVDQYFKVTLTPRVKPVKPFDPTNPKDPNKPVPGQPIDPDTPVDPNNPNDPTIPRWTEDLINKLETTKQVTRTINYVDEEGNKVSEQSTDKVTFTREAKINVVTGEVTYGDWKAVGGDSTFDAVKSPVVKGYLLKDANQKEVSSTTVKSDAKDETITVTYTKVGSYVPKVPEGVTPPSPTPYDNDPEDPTKVVTPNPEKPQDPKDPNSPKVPVLPRVPGHTPIVPKDPTKPVSPENPLVPLTPVDPNHPEKGYNVPPVPTTPGQDTPIEYVKDGQQRAIVNFVDENGNSVAASILQTGNAGDKFTKDALVKSTISELQSKGYEVKTNDYPKEGTGVFDNDTKVDQIFTVTVRKIEVLPPTPRVVERPGGNTVVEVGVPNKDADTLNIWYTKRNNPNAPREEIVTKKDKDGTWKIEKAPEGVTVNPSTGIVSIPGNKIQPKTWIDTQTKHETKLSKIVSVMPNIHDLKEFVGTTEWIDVEGKVLKPSEEGIHEKGRFDNLVWLVTILEGDKITHIFGPGTPTVDKPEYKITVWFDKDGNPIKPDKPGTHESGKIPGYRFITTTTKDGVTVHKFEKITPSSPTIPNVVPGKVTEKHQVKRLANTGTTETNTGLAGLGLAMVGMALAAIKRRKDK